MIDKDHASGLLAAQLNCDDYFMLTDVDAVYRRWGTDAARALRKVTPEQLEQMPFAAASMGPKVAAAIKFAKLTNGFSGIGTLKDAGKIPDGTAGTIVRRSR